MRPERSPRTFAVALAVSLVAHASAYVWLSRRGVGDGAFSDSFNSAVEIDIVRAAPGPVVAAPAPAQLGGPRRLLAARRDGSPSPERKAPARQPPLAGAARPDIAPETASDAPRIAPLAPRPALASNSAVPVGGIRGTMPVPFGSPTARSTGELVQGFAAEVAGKARVERGLADDYFVDLGKKLVAVWDAERAVSREGLKGFLEQSRENFQTMNRIWLQHAADYGATGKPIGDDPLGSPLSRTLPPGNPDLRAYEAMKKAFFERFRAGRVAIIRVTQDLAGELTSVELVSASNDIAVDREALNDVRAAAGVLPRPSAEAVAGKERVVSLWQFELLVSITPPVPTFTFEFDEVLKFVDARMPLDRRVYKRVRLLSVQ